ncbi:transcriptional regulator, TetR family [Promicromonospora thailandica]|uniref:Transcriptional regulator, TetR family n=2 Tax=Promicromonospora thailandica TaxID=765201 RepID=A0A9X2JXA2_9MICO|nr:transcriptional regulator, TetR family [Promicromonospora thailandica]
MSESKGVGRPRAFDPDEALEKAMIFFWQHGYEGASLAGLTKAMGISTTSMYATFGNKEQLFRKALRRYDDHPEGYLEPALREPTARGVATVLLNGAVNGTTRPDMPHGCLGVQSALVTSDGATQIRELLNERRRDIDARLRERFDRAADEGDLPAGTTPAVLTRLLSTAMSGIAVQAAGGVSREELQAMADAVLRAWPAPEPEPGPAPEPAQVR